MWRKFNIPKGKWEFWFGNFLFFCHIWKMLTFKRLGEFKHSCYMDSSSRTSLYLTLSYIRKHRAMGFGIFSHCSAPKENDFDVLESCCIVTSYFLRFFLFFVKKKKCFVALILFLPYFHNLCTYQTGASETKNM